MSLPTITHRLPAGPCTVESFRQLPKGAILKLYYWATNRGEFFWEHDRVADVATDTRVFGRFAYADALAPAGRGWSDIDDYLYEFCGYVCRGSGAEPVCGEPLEEPWYG